jgi:hypothetical protein
MLTKGGPLVLNVMLVGSMLAASLTAPANPALILEPTPPPTTPITVELVTVNGSGCPAGSAAVAVAPDNTAFTVTYSAYMALVGVGSLPTDFRKNCQLAVRVHVPQGFTYAVAKADYRGYAYLEKGATGTERANYYFQGQSPTTFISHPFGGPMDDNWQTLDEVDLAAMVFAPCGEERFLNINTELRVAAGSSDPKTTTSFMAMDSTDTEINTVYHFSWRQCP